MADEESFMEFLIELTGGNHSTIGDDCAVLSFGEKTLLATVDNLVENIHFTKEASLTQIVRKLARVNLSDVAAMGGEPNWALFSEATKHSFNERKQAAELLVDELNTYGIELVGGDLSSTGSSGDSFLSMTVLGQATDGMTLRRTQAEPGDLIAVSGPLGGVRAVLENDGPRNKQDAEIMYSIPVNLNLGQQLVSLGLKCAIDLSDGLLKDLGRVCRASGVGAVLTWQKIPVHNYAETHSENRHQKVEWALEGGEDFQLLTAVPEKKVASLPEEFTVIGRFVEGENINFEPELPEGIGQNYGYDHFR